MGAYLSAPVTDKQSFDGATRGVRYGGSAMQGWRRNMEDAHFVHVSEKHPDITVFGVFDGHGGCEVARFCEKYLPSEFPSIEGFPENIESALIRVFHRMDEMLKEETFKTELEEMRMSGEATNGESEERTDESGDSTNGNNAAESVLKQLDLVRKLMFASDGSGGTEDDYSNGSDSSSSNDPIDQMNQMDSLVQAGATAIVAVLKGNELYVANAGDSRGVLCRGTRAVALSHDHKPSLDAERTRIEAAGGFLSDIAGMCRVNGNLNLSRAIGDLRYKCNAELMPKDQIITAEPDVTTFTIQPDDRFFILACDGVWDVMDNQQVVDFVLSGLKEDKGVSEISAELLDRCLAMDPKLTRGVGCDNMTCLIAVFDAESPLTTPQPETASPPARVPLPTPSSPPPGTA